VIAATTRSSVRPTPPQARVVRWSTRPHKPCRRYRPGIRCTIVRDTRPKPSAVNSSALARSRSAGVNRDGSYSGRPTPPPSGPPARPHSTCRMCRCHANALSRAAAGAVSNNPHCGTDCPDSATTCHRAPRNRTRAPTAATAAAHPAVPRSPRLPHAPALDARHRRAHQDAFVQRLVQGRRQPSATGRERRRGGPRSGHRSPRRPRSAAPYPCERIEYRGHQARAAPIAGMPVAGRPPQVRHRHRIRRPQPPISTNRPRTAPRPSPPRPVMAVYAPRWRGWGTRPGPPHPPPHRTAHRCPRRSTWP